MRPGAPSCIENKQTRLDLHLGPFGLDQTLGAM
jgi:hypothetical protein